MTTGAVALRIKGSLAIVTHSTELTGINLVHFYFNRPLLHLREHLLVVTLLTGHTRILVDLTGKSNCPH